MGIKSIITIDKEETDDQTDKMLFPLSELNAAIKDGINISDLLFSVFRQHEVNCEPEDIYCFFRSGETGSIGEMFKFENHYIELGITLDKLIEFLNDSEEIDQLILFVKTPEL